MTTDEDNNGRQSNQAAITDLTDIDLIDAEDHVIPDDNEIVCASDGSVDDDPADCAANANSIDDGYRRAQSRRDNYQTDNGFTFGPEDNLLGQDVVGIIRRLDTLKEEIDMTDDTVIEQNSKQEYVRLARKLDTPDDNSNAGRRL
ncbi:hypothetical protein [Halorubrum sp. N11]|uniref:hypothetical protein n=1 Tax=Halorubrum sp. N11 TaxID=3402276 RepID=UPI003EC01947